MRRSEVRVFSPAPTNSRAAMRKHRGPFPFPTSRFCDVAHIAAFIAAPHPPPHRLRSACDDTHRSTCAPRTPTAASALHLATRFSRRDGAAECDRRTNRPPPSAQTTRHQYKTESRLTCPPSIARYRLGKRVATLTADAGAGSALPADPSAEVRSPEAAKAELAIRSCPTSLPRLNARAPRAEPFRPASSPRYPASLCEASTPDDPLRAPGPHAVVRQPPS